MYNTKRDIMKEIKKFLCSFLKDKDILVVACSGGPDSMCLLHLLLSLKSDYNLKIICAHVNHNVRKESAFEEEFVKKYCYDNDIIFETTNFSYDKNSFSEKDAHERRYAFFEKIVRKYHANYLLTAHHGDDLVETILMRIVRGSNLKGYGGIEKVSLKEGFKIVRPLLSLTKEDIYGYLKDNCLKYVIDGSNKDLKYTRNRYRKHLLPFLKKEEKNVHLKFLKFSEELIEYHEYINKLLEDKIKKVYVDGRVIISKLLLEDKFIQKRILEYVTRIIQKDDRLDINDEQIKLIFKLLKSKDNKMVDLANGYCARISYDNLFIEKKSNLEKKEYEYIIDKKIEILDKYCIEVVNQSNEKSNNILRLNKKDIALPLRVRNMLLDDIMAVKNMNGTKKVRDILKDCKIDKYERAIYPVVIDSKNRLIWVPGLKKSIFDKEISEKYDIILKYMEGKNECTK